MKNFFMTAMLSISVFVSAAPQEDADRIIGTYLATYEGEESKVSIFKEDDGTYTARVIWVLNKYDENGNVKTDEKNPDKSKRNTPCDEIVLIERMIRTLVELRSSTGGKSPNRNSAFGGRAKRPDRQR